MKQFISKTIRIQNKKYFSIKNQVDLFCYHVNGENVSENLLFVHGLLGAHNTWWYMARKQSVKIELLMLIGKESSQFVFD